MKFRYKRGNCGPAALVNALKFYGEDYKEEEIALWCKKNSRGGTDEKKLTQGVRKVKHGVRELVSKNERAALHRLFGAVNRGWPVMLCVDNDEHWVTVIGRGGRRVVIFDSSRERLNLLENGVAVLSGNELAEWWVNEDNEYYGIVVLPKVKSG